MTLTHAVRDAHRRPRRELRATLAFWRDVARGATQDHPSHVVVRVLEGLARREERRA